MPSASIPFTFLKRAVRHCRAPIGTRNMAKQSEDNLPIARIQSHIHSSLLSTLRRSKMASKKVPVLAAQPPWKLKGTIYTFMLYTSSKDAEVLSSDPSFLYSPLEASSKFTRGKLIGGLAMVQVIRYSESPVGPYDEFLMVPGAFQYDAAVEQNARAELKLKKNARVSRIYVSQKNTCWNGRMSESRFWKPYKASSKD